MKDRIDAAEVAITTLERVGYLKADSVAHCMALEDERPLVKAQAIGRMIGTENPATKKPHSASSAEAVVETHPKYAAHRARQRDAEVTKIRHYADYDAAKLRAQLAVGLATMASEVTA